MITIFAGRKGGSGKSTLACNLAPILARKGARVAVVDHDPQGTVKRWGAYRQEAEGLPRVDVIDPFLGDWLEQTLEEYDHVLVDTQGADSDQNRAVLSRLAEYDVPIRLVIPVKPSQPDIDVLEYVKEHIISVLQAVRPDIRIRFVLNEAPTTTKKEREEALRWFKAYGVDDVPSTIHSRKAFRDSMALGRSVIEMPDADKAAEEISAVYRDLFVN